MNVKYNSRKIISILLVLVMIFASIVDIRVNTYADDTYVDVTMDMSENEDDQTIQVEEVDAEQSTENSVESVDEPSSDVTMPEESSQSTETTVEETTVTDESTTSVVDENDESKVEETATVDSTENHDEDAVVEEPVDEENSTTDEIVETNPATAEETTESESDDVVNEEPTVEESSETSTETTLEEVIDLTPYENMDFNSMRLLVAGVNAELMATMPVIAEYDGMYMLQFDSVDDTRLAYAKLDGKAQFLVVDTTFVLNEGESDGQPSEMDENNNAFTNLETELNHTSSTAYDIAVIDSGSNNAGVTKVSMLGDDGSDDHGHGTNMINLMLAQNPNAKILSIKAFTSDGASDASTVYAAIEYAMQSNVRIINMSFSAFQTANNEFVKAKIEEALANGIVVIASAGNYNTDAKYFIPANIDGVLTIGAMHENLTKNSSSNMGAVVDYYVVAPSTSEAAARFTGAYSINNTVPSFAKEMYSDEPVINENPDPATEDFILDSYCTSAFIIGILNVNQLGGGLGNIGSVSVKLTNDMIQSITTPMMGHNALARTYTFEYIVIEGATVTNDHSGSNGAATGINFSGCTGNFADFAKIGAYASRDCGGNTYGNYDQSGGEDRLAGGNTWFDNTFKGKVIITAANVAGGHTIPAFQRDSAGNLIQGQPVIVYSFHPNAWNRQNSTANAVLSFENSTHDLYMYVEKSAPSGFSAQGATFGVYASNADASADRNRLSTLTIDADGKSSSYTHTTAETSVTLYVKELTTPTQSGDFEWIKDTSIKSVTLTTSNTSSNPGKVSFTNNVRQYGYVLVEKIVPEGFSGQGATFGVYGSQADATNNTNKLATLTIGANGKSNAYKVTLPDGIGQSKTVYIRELSGPSQSGQFSWQLDTSIKSATITASNTSSVPYVVSIPNSITVPTTIVKDVDKSRAKNLAVGAQFTMYYAGTNEIVKDVNGTDCIFTVKLDSAGNLVTETYTIKLRNAKNGDNVVIKETHVPTGFSKAPDRTVTLSATDKNSFTIINHYETQSVFIRKTTNRPELLSLYPITGTKYGLYTDANARTLAKDINTGEDCIFVCAVNGKSQTFEVPLGTYYVKEISTTEWYELNTEITPVELRSDGTLTELQMENMLKPGKGMVEKGFH